MKRWWWLVIALALSVGVNVGILATRLLPAKAPAVTEAAAVDQPGLDPGPSPRPFERQLPAMVDRMADELGLEGARRAAFVENQRRFFRQTMEARSRVQRHQRRLRQEMASPEADRAAIEETLEQLTVARGDLEKAFVENLLETRELLDPEQRRRFIRLLGRISQKRDDFERHLRRPGQRTPWNRPQNRRPPERQPLERQPLDERPDG